MVDSLARSQRSWNMGRIHGKNTKPELSVRRVLHRNGFRFRLHDKTLPGSPDIVLRKYQTVIFVHGCFWHHHGRCARASLPRTNRRFWLKKIFGNVVRDKRDKRRLTRQRWRVLTIWQCETRNLSDLERRLVTALREAKRVKANLLTK